MDILRIATAGSVDDGKSTLIGRLLYETRSVPKDRLEAIEAAGRRRGTGDLDLSLLTDGLIAEREQGITIDVAHVYFSTPRRKYIIADTPGHFEYTRNMVTGASRASVSIILIDARNGVVEQTARHAFIAALLRIPRVIVCVNKMDLVAWSSTRFAEVVADFRNLLQDDSLGGQHIDFIPVSSLHGDNITRRSPNAPWHTGPTLLELLEGAETRRSLVVPARLPVQLVIRARSDPASHGNRGYAGRIASGAFAVGDEVVIQPGERRSVITGIERYDQSLLRAVAGESILLRLADDIDIHRGSLIARDGEQPAPRVRLRARVCWLGEIPLAAGKTYVLQHGVNRVRAKVTDVHSVLDLEAAYRRAFADHEALARLTLNEIGDVSLRLGSPIFADDYALNPANGAFILIDEVTHNTVGAGFVEPDITPESAAELPLGFGV